MDKTTKTMLCVASLVLGLLFGVNYMLSRERDGGWLLIAIIFFIVALLLWWWIGEPERRAKRNAEEEAREKIRLAEEELRKARATTSATLPKPVDATARIASATVAEPTPVQAVQAEPVKVDTPKVAVSSLAPEPEAVKVETPKAPEPEAVKVETPKAPEPEAVKVETPKAPEPAPIVAEATKAPEPVKENPVADAKKSTDGKKGKTKSGEDDLTLIEGIGPYYRDVLHKGDVKTFEALSKMSHEAIDDLIKAQGARRSMTTASWAEQAALAAKGDWEALETLQTNLIGGRKK
jgi:predicted flap endonuclease-1-like 5' DNA nuclease/cbb3-type cytochrome oxidase subunit 3